MIGHRAPISGIACWRDQYVATAGYDNQVVLWDAQTGAGLNRALHDHLANQCAFSRDGRWLLTASSDWSGRIWSLPDLRLHAVLRGHEDDVEMAAFHPNEELVATASRDHRVRVFRLDGTLVRVFEGHLADVLSVEWAADGEQLLSSSDDGTIRRWCLRTGELVDTLDMRGVETDTIALTARGTIYAGDDEGRISVITPDGGIDRLPAHAAGVKRLVLSPEQDLLVSLSYDRSAKLWDIDRPVPQLVTSTTMPDDVWPRSCAFASKSRLLFGTFGQTYRTFDTVSGLWDPSPVPPTAGLNATAATATPGTALTVGDAGVVWASSGTTAEPVEVARTGSLCNFLTPVGGVVLTGGQLGRLFDARTGRALHQHRSPLNCAAAFTRSETDFAVVGTYTGEGVLVRVTGSDVAHVRDLPLLNNAVKGLAVGSSLLFAVCADCSAVWWDLDTLQPVRVVPRAHDRIVNGCVSLGEDSFASVSRDRTLRIWESSGAVEVVLTPHLHSIKCVTASPDGLLIATAGYDGTIGLYERISGRWRTSRPTASGISSLAVDAARQEFLASSYDGLLYRIPFGPA